MSNVFIFSSVSTYSYSYFAHTDSTLTLWSSSLYCWRYSWRMAGSHLSCTSYSYTGTACWCKPAWSSLFLQTEASHYKSCTLHNYSPYTLHTYHTWTCTFIFKIFTNFPRSASTSIFNSTLMRLKKMTKHKLLVLSQSLAYHASNPFKSGWFE